MGELLVILLFVFRIQESEDALFGKAHTVGEMSKEHGDKRKNEEARALKKIIKIYV